jgi:hypothetical protein
MSETLSPADDDGSKPDVSVHYARDLTLAGMMGALAIVLPMAFHGIPKAGPVFLPMFWPVLALGMLVSRWWVAALLGLVVPLLSSAVTAMPPAQMAPLMAGELAALAAGAALTRRVKDSLLLAAVAGLVAARAARAAEFFVLAPHLGVKVGFVEFAFLGVLESWPGLLVLALGVPGVVRVIEAASVLGRSPR